MISVHLFAFLDFINTLDIDQNNAHEVIFPIKNLFLLNENLNKFRKYLLKAYILQTF